MKRSENERVIKKSEKRKSDEERKENRSDLGKTAWKVAAHPIYFQNHAVRDLLTGVQVDSLNNQNTCNLPLI